ncbi:hypothetical protein BH11ACT8_BH11ACT8_14930 [soil metagenome]
MTSPPPPGPARSRTHRTGRALAAAAALALLALGAVGCSADESSDVSSAAEPAYAGAPSAGDAGGGAVDGLQDGNALSSDSSGSDLVTGDVAESTKVARADVSDTRSLIKTGNVALTSTDVAKARFDVQKIVDQHRGEISERSTEADPDGTEARARLVLRVPAADFDAVMEGLEGVGELISSDGAVEDVTTQVIDNDVRVALQRRSIERISVLLDRASSIRDIVNIERELSRREADLGSLEKRQTYLADQTEMGTITVSIEKPDANQTTLTREGDVKVDGFVAGLVGGWSTFRSVTTGLLTALGAVLPFAVLLLLVGVPVRLLLRRGRSATQGPAMSPTMSPTVSPTVSPDGQSG